MIRLSVPPYVVECLHQGVTALIYKPSPLGCSPYGEAGDTVLVSGDPWMRVRIISINLVNFAPTGGYAWRIELERIKCV